MVVLETEIFQRLNEKSVARVLVIRPVQPSLLFGCVFTDTDETMSVQNRVQNVSLIYTSRCVAMIHVEHTKTRGKRTHAAAGRDFLVSRGT